MLMMTIIKAPDIAVLEPFAYKWLFCVKHVHGTYSDTCVVGILDNDKAIATNAVICTQFKHQAETEFKGFFSASDVLSKSKYLSNTKYKSVNVLTTRDRLSVKLNLASPQKSILQRRSINQL